MSVLGYMSLYRMSGVHLDYESALVFIWMHKSDLDYDGVLGCILYRECLSRFLEYGV